MRAGTHNFNCDQGATFSRLIEVEQPDPADPTGETFLPLNIAGFQARMQIRRTITSENFLASLTSPGNGLTVNPNPSEAENQILIFMSDEVTASISTSGVYDLEIESPTGVVSRVLQGEFILSPEVTK